MSNLWNSDPDRYSHPSYVEANSRPERRPARVIENDRPAARETYRLSAHDEQRLTDCARGLVEDFREHNKDRYVDTFTRLTWQRRMAHAIGCGIHDLRPVELDQVDAALRDAIGENVQP